jgi:hypothetical protein
MKFFAIFCAAFGTSLLLFQIYKLKKYDFIDGKVVEIKKSESSDGDSYKPRIMYMSKNNKESYYEPFAYTNLMSFKLQ